MHLGEEGEVGNYCGDTGGGGGGSEDLKNA